MRHGERGGPLHVRQGIVEIGNAHGKIAVYLDEREAVDLAGLYGPRDEFSVEIMRAVEVAYPPAEEQQEIGT